MNTTSSAQPGFAVAGVAPGDIFEKPDQTFPRLPAEMVDRVLRYGHPETFDGGAYLYQFGERAFDFFLILDGTVDALDNDGKGGNIVLTTYGANQFSGELNLRRFSARVLCGPRSSSASREPASGEWLVPNPISVKSYCAPIFCGGPA